MAFTRDELTAYESQKPAEAAATVESAPTSAATKTEEAAIPAKTELAQDDSSSSSESDQNVSGSDDPSAEVLDAEAAAATAAPGSEGEADSSAQPPARKGSAEDRIAELVAERNALRKYGEHLQRVNEQLLKGGKSAESVPAPAEPAANDKGDPRPKLEDFPNYEAFAKAENEWLDKRVDTLVEKRLSQRDGVSKEQQAIAAFERGTAEFKKVHPDFEAVVSNPDLPKLPPTAARHVVFSERGAELVYYLGTHVDLATRISRMSPENQIQALNKLEGKLEALSEQTTTVAAQPVKQPTQKQQPQQKPKATTQAPPPPTPVKAGGKVEKDIGEMSMDEFVAHERGKALASREARQRLRQSMR